MLAALGSHPYLKGKLALKGETALNLFVFNVPRLSFDIDLNYVGAEDREALLAERPRIEQAVQAVFAREGFTVRQAGFDLIQQEQMVPTYIEKHGAIKSAEVMELCRITKDQAYRLLKVFEMLGKLAWREMARPPFTRDLPKIRAPRIKYVYSDRAESAGSPSSRTVFHPGQ